MKNPNCDNELCKFSKSEVRVLPTGGDSNLILCATCYKHEIQFRIERNKTLGEREKFKLPFWEELEIYRQCEQE